MKNLSFFKIISGWFVIAVALLVANSFTFKSSLAHSVVLASLGCILFIHPVYPDSLETKYDSGKCRRIIRIIAAIEIILSFLVQTIF